MVAVFVLAVFLFIIAADIIVLKFQGKKHPAFATAIPQYGSSIHDENDISIPSDIIISKGHTWIKFGRDGLADIGIDAFGAAALGKMSVVKCADEGKEIKKGEIIFEGSYGDKTVKFLSPVNGFVKAVNSNIIGKKISGPYEMWGIKLITDSKENKRQFLSGNEAQNWMKNEFIRLKSFIENFTPDTGLAGVTMYDGGKLSDELASSFTAEAIANFEKEFLSL